ncbi:DUF350 domain-containing protein [Novosphingobium sp. FSY-8]|uniref:DUF350 domain-containing protein n=1 Tax=Novosphingobium ovatum TaxID=1908523 RepID=A0ABW9XE13_9SPHN|nr:DUF350 domain-containing protein [Novosphingobium ovatum]NBC36750.1 DUF350 domain-containing protein [Novosphingobium ovatum]
MIDAEHLLASVIYAGLGILVLFIAFLLVDRLTPGDMWKEIIEKENKAVAMLAAAGALGLSIIIAAAIHG